MMATLVRKELRQHWAALLVLALLTLAGYGLILAAFSMADQTGSVFESLRVFVMILVVLAGLVLCHRLVVVEYAARTQLFLEALPVARWRMVAVKYGLGLLVIGGIVAFGLGLACVLGASREALTVRFVAILAARALSAAICAYHFFFLMGFLGRYRLAFYVAAVLAVVAVSELTDLRLDQFGPFALLDEKFAYESRRVPWAALRETWILAGVFLILAFLLALSREGSVAALLAEKMSHREKIFVAASLIGLVFVITVLSERTRRAPFTLHDAVTEERPGVTAKVASEFGLAPGAAGELARAVAEDLAAMREYLGIPGLPPVFVTRRRDLDVHRYERGELEQASGVHVQANFGAPEFRRDRFLAWLRREVLIVHTDERVKLEPKQWVLDGFVLQDPAGLVAGGSTNRDRRLLLGALYGTETGFTPRDVREWQRFRERVGADIAAAVAWSGLDTLARQAGPERARRFVKSVLGAEVPQDVRALWHERAAPLERLLAEEAGVTWDAFWARWQEDLTRARRELAGELAALPRLRGEVRFNVLSKDSREAAYRVRIEPAPPPGTRYSLLHHELPVFDEEVAPQLLRREHQPYATRSAGTLPGGFSRGGRLYWTFALDVPALGGEVISGWRREVIP